MKKHPGIIKFKRDLRKLCKRHDVKLLLINKPSIPFVGNKDIQVSGYFDSAINEMAVATKKDGIEWLEILIHESCHLDQFLENTKIWNSTDYDGIDACGLIDLWLMKVIELRPRILDEMIHKIIAMERDCDMRAVRKIKKYGLDEIIDIDKYIRKSNAYHLSYVAVKKLRKWNKQNMPAYNSKEVVDLFPSKFCRNFTLTKKQFAVMKKHCY